MKQTLFSSFILDRYSLNKYSTTLALLLTFAFLVGSPTIGFTQTETVDRTTTDTTTILNSLDGVVTLHDSLQLCYTYKTNPKKKAKALIVTLPMRSRTRATYSKIDDFLAETFPQLSFIDFDLRGHGKSVLAGADTLDFQTMSREAYTKIPHDIKEGLRLIRNKHKSLRRIPIIVIGASIGANSAGILANIEDRVKAVVLLSPGKDYVGLLPEPHLKMTDHKDILFMVGNQDTYSFESTKELYEITEGRKVLNVYNSPSHGTNIPNNIDQALTDLANWLQTVLKTLKK